MGWFKTEGGKNDDLLAVYKGPGHNGHFGAQYLQKSLVTFPWLHYLSAAGKFTGIILHHVQTQQSFKSQCRPGALDVPPIFALSDPVSASWRRRTGTAPLLVAWRAGQPKIRRANRCRLRWKLIVFRRLPRWWSPPASGSKFRGAPVGREISRPGGPSGPGRLGYDSPLVRRASRAEGGTARQPVDARITDPRAASAFEGQIIGKHF